ncbi:DUF4350 domain-containing protein [Frondihabitans peucedani]|uniref:DUF4350 domain-containing protein n=1 Tax=Frondihabitans peucedani TaxID=598626 RepID=A0ABP8DZL2_9MICO
MTTTANRPDVRQRTSGRPAGGASRSRAALIAAGVVVVIVFAILAIVGITGRGGQALSATSTGPDGAAALVSVLRQHGIEVVEAPTLAEARSAAADDPSSTTVLAYDPGPYLTPSQWKRLAGSASRTVVVQPDAGALDALAPGTTIRGDLAGTLSPGCDLPALRKTREITGSGTGYTTTDSSAVRCLSAGTSASYGLVQVSRDGGEHTTTILGASGALTNSSITDDDNAAFALTLLGQTDRLVWYLPSVDDLPNGSGSFASLTPGWVTPSVVLLAAAALAAAFWRGRRLGPLVVENLPVVVRSTETMEGRARLYERGENRRHALDQLRIGTLGRLAALLGLGRAAGVDEVVLRTADLIGADPRQLRHVLVDADPQDDRHLLALSDSLRDLEGAVARAVRPR